MTRQSGTSDKVLRYLITQRNVEVHVNDLAAATGLDRKQVISAVNHLRRSTVILSPRKSWYVYQGSKTSENGHRAVSVKAKAEVQALLNDDRVLLVIEGELYVASRVEV